MKLNETRISQEKLLQEKEIWTLNEVVEKLRLCRQSVVKLTKLGVLPCYISGRRVFFRRDDVNAAIARGLTPLEK